MNESVGNNSQSAVCLLWFVRRARCVAVVAVAVVAVVVAVVVVVVVARSLARSLSRGGLVACLLPYLISKIAVAAIKSSHPEDLFFSTTISKLDVCAIE
jgi:hypothetical protein